MYNWRQRNQDTGRLIFNGNDLSEYVAYKVNRPVMAPIEVSTETIPGRHGELFRSARLQGYDLSVDVWLMADNRLEVADVRHRLAAALWTDEPAPLYLPDDPTRYVLAIVTGETDLGQITDKTAGTITFRVTDPICYGNHNSRVLYDGSSASVDAGGTWETYPTVTFKPTMKTSHVSVLNADTGDKVAVNGTFTVGDEVFIDMATEHVTHNGATISPTVDSDFFTIKGVTKIVTSGSGATMEWDEAWL